MGDGPIRCLVGDDHATLRSGVVALLDAESDIEVIGEASDGQEVLSMTERRRPDVTIVDVRMPNKDGIELCREIDAMQLPTAVVLYTAFGDAETLESGLDAGARGFVLKSGPPGDLLRAVRAASIGQPYIDASLTGALLERRRQDPASSLLSKRENEVLQLLADGTTTEDTAAALFLSPTTVRSYAESAMHKLEARNRTHAVAEALRLGLIR